MPTVHETVYPRLKISLSRRELGELYAPIDAELPLAERSCKGEPARLAFLVLIKTFQRLGYLIALRDVPRGIFVAARFGRTIRSCLIARQKIK